MIMIPIVITQYSLRVETRVTIWLRCDFDMESFLLGRTLTRCQVTQLYQYYDCTHGKSPLSQIIIYHCNYSLLQRQFEGFFCK